MRILLLSSTSVYGCREGGNTQFCLWQKKDDEQNCNDWYPGWIFKKVIDNVCQAPEQVTTGDLKKPEPPEWTKKQYPVSKSTLFWAMGLTKWFREIPSNLIYSLIPVYNTHISFSTFEFLTQILWILLLHLAAFSQKPQTWSHSINCIKMT